MFQKLVVLFMVVALSVASAKTFTITLFQPSLVGGTELKPGEYELNLKDAKVVIKGAKQSIEAPVKVENADTKFSTTSVRYSNGEGKYRIQEIRLGGTKLRLVFN